MQGLETRIDSIYAMRYAPPRQCGTNFCAVVNGSGSPALAYWRWVDPDRCFAVGEGSEFIQRIPECYKRRFKGCCQEGYPAIKLCSKTSLHNRWRQINGHVNHCKQGKWAEYKSCLFVWASDPGGKLANLVLNNQTSYFKNCSRCFLQILMEDSQYKFSGIDRNIHYLQYLIFFRSQS